ncbi:MAG TPA: hypothetical protein VMB47_14305 [Candidatus Aquilonibacter sp.]|nr:hypothetical protein [Candidatus Aquilonibacter sp.]
MEPEHIRFGGGAAATMLHPLVAVGVLIAIVLILKLPREKAIVPFLFAVLTIPWGQVAVIGGVHFTMMRILILAGLARAIKSKASSSERWFATGFSRIDQAVVLWLAFLFIVNTLQWMNPQMLIAQLGDFLDALGGYLVVRFFVPDGEALRRTIKVLAAICVVHGLTMLYEQLTGLNVFNLLGGVPIEGSIIRAGELRSSGIMGPLGEGPFAGVLLPLFIWLWKEEKSRMIAFAGIAGALAMLITAHASTPWMAVGGGLLGLSFWPLRKQMRVIRWGFVLTLVALHLYMKSPVWHLISDVNLTGDSSSYHRYTLINQSILHFRDWWLLGCKNYANWDWDMWDTSDLFVATALTGGLISLVCLIAAFKRSFAAIGTARKLVQGDRRQEWYLWCLGSALLAVVVASLGIAFLYQARLEVFALFGFIAVATFEAKPAVVPAVAPMGQREPTRTLAAARTVPSFGTNQVTGPRNRFS